MTIFISLVVCLVGLFMYYAAAKAETKEAGRIMFAFGLLAFLLQLGPQVVGLLQGRQ